MLDTYKHVQSPALIGLTHFQLPSPPGGVAWTQIQVVRRRVLWVRQSFRVIRKTTYVSQVVITNLLGHTAVPRVVEQRIC